MPKILLFLTKNDVASLSVSYIIFHLNNLLTLQIIKSRNCINVSSFFILPLLDIGVCIVSQEKSVSRASLLKSVFSDPKNYPYGFSRSGDFSIAESKALNSFGCLFAALIDGKFEPENDDDHYIIAVAHGVEEPKDTAQRAWLKYQKRINRPKACSIHGTTKSASTGDDDDLVSDIDDDISLNVDED